MGMAKLSGLLALGPTTSSVSTLRSSLELVDVIVPDARVQEGPQKPLSASSGRGLVSSWAVST